MIPIVQARTSPFSTQSITQRDAQGRITAENTTVPQLTAVNEQAVWRGDSKLSTYAAAGSIIANGTGTDLRTYDYDARGRVLTEPFFMVDSPNTADLPNGMVTGTFQFDYGSQGGIGLRTLQEVTPYAADAVSSYDVFLRTYEDDSYHGNGTWSPWVLGYDAAGYATSRISESGTSVHCSQNLVWDAWGRLVQVTQSNTGTGDFQSTTVYDGLGRRVQMTWQPMTNGTANGSSSCLQYYYDPQVEFQELGWNNNGNRTWKVYGPDVNGVYGGEQGCGGLVNEVNESAGFAYVPLNNLFGDAEGTQYFASLSGTASTTNYTYGLALGGYGPEPGLTLYNIGGQLTPQWRGHSVDWTGFVYMGARYYEPLSGKFLSPDPLGHGASMSLYDYCAGDPVNGLDPDGRCIERNPDVAQAAYSAGEDAYPIVQNAAAGKPDATTDAQIAQSGLTLNAFANSLESHGINAYDENYNISDFVQNAAVQYYQNTAAQNEANYAANYPVTHAITSTVNATLSNYWVQAALILSPIAFEAGGNYLSSSIDESMPSGFSYGPGGSPINMNSINFKGPAGMQWQADYLAANPSLVPEITIQSFGPSGMSARLDAVGTGVLVDNKLSFTAPMTNNQGIVYPELSEFGGVVVGSGKSPFVGGTIIPPTPVSIVTPQGTITINPKGTN